MHRHCPRPSFLLALSLSQRRGRPKRHYRLPVRYQGMLLSSRTPMPGRHNDMLPEAPTALPPLPPETPRLLPRVILHVRETIRTALNKFGVLREYPHRPTYDPESALTPKDLSDYSGYVRGYESEPTPPVATTPTAQPSLLTSPPSPFANMSIYRPMRWLTTGPNTKSLAEGDRLLNQVLLADDFNPEDLRNHRPSSEVLKLDGTPITTAIQPSVADEPVTQGCTAQSTSWREVPVKFSVPTGTVVAHSSSTTFTVAGTCPRSLVGVIRSAFTAPLPRQFHLTPFRRFWQSISGERRIYDEPYTSDAWLDADKELQQSPREPGCSLERVIAGLMFWSDATTLAHFSSAKAWPIYLYFGNLSKYVRGKAISGACHHVAYIPPVGCMSSKAQLHLLTMFAMHSSCPTTSVNSLVLFVQTRSSSSPIVSVNCSTQSGENYWMLSSLKHTSMASLFAARTACYVECILGSSLTPLTTQRSMH